jgi:hypothetical protein
LKEDEELGDQDVVGVDEDLRQKLKVEGHQEETQEEGHQEADLLN